jgi:hypothetical protein
MGPGRPGHNVSQASAAVVLLMSPQTLVLMDCIHGHHGSSLATVGSRCPTLAYICH